MTTIDEPSTEAEARASLRWLLRRDHERLERMFEDLLAAFEADARDHAARLWGDFDAALQTHLDLEERLILPAFREVDALEADALLADHRRFRAQLAELGAGLDLHLLRSEVVRDFITHLRHHAQREDELLYRWADRALDPAARAMLTARLAAGVRSFIAGVAGRGETKGSSRAH